MRRNKMTWEETEKNLENLKKAGKRLVGEKLPTDYTSHKKLHVPGRPWTWPAWDK
jgi:hypothetical protein